MSNYKEVLAKEILARAERIPYNPEWTLLEQNQIHAAKDLAKYVLDSSTSYVAPEWEGLLNAFDFPTNSLALVIQFDDGSECKFFYAFYRREGDRLVVYTEHCGYHSFHGNTEVVIGLDRTAECKDG